MRTAPHIRSRYCPATPRNCSAKRASPLAVSEDDLDHDSYPDVYIKSILTTTKTLALVGASANPARPSYIVLKYLSERGYRVIPVNPGLAGQTICGQEVV